MYSGKIVKCQYRASKLRDDSSHAAHDLFLFNRRIAVVIIDRLVG